MEEQIHMNVYINMNMYVSIYIIMDIELHCTKFP